ncbi:hypothetical protein QA648_00470 [Rhizobium sp. CB3171]|uniref:hypothetical protein n=1 Tax=Rhizobium sp. CB3171 TaxID=3039157 RepID=UPI0024B0F6B1|nr:hypothetical protein [Rhizobium sp. CB3171]WFU02293.1 hypothetical protein QA648_00470 [Rhizobium sp. CB3171]
MARKKINHDNMPARFPEGTFVRMDNVLAEGETRMDLVRGAVDLELRKRERVAKRQAEETEKPDL